MAPNSTMAPIRPNPTLSEDVISEILLRHAITSKTDQTLLMRYRHDSPAVKEISVLDVDSHQIVAELKLPCSQSEPNFIILGSVNGIVCVIVIISTDEASVYLWNPASRKSKLIPSIDVHVPSGFGYDPIDDDYKVVSIGTSEYYSVDVYLANMDAWRHAPDPIDITYPIDIPSNRFFDVCVKGFLFGIGGYSMVVFDLHKEVLNWAIKLPVIIRDVHDDDDSEYDETRIIEFNNSIAVITLWDKGWNNGKKINMWTLDDDACLSDGGVEASWTTMFSIDLAASAYLVLGYFNNRDLLVLIGGDNCMLCNADKKEANIVPLSVEMAGHQYGRAVYKYTESLVSLAGFKQINWNTVENDN
ncbi:F-box domain-containing protein [Heracleum sosnowskyi]|uniref:F-box domain-containing protein n=1 Tax=Heracleum sosnowskyi TaxID=360622 RepID=A0AAD8GR63_9APIA|nr:F-box domain-containing protein [Heracleum sosnowskyi]